MAPATRPVTHSGQATMAPPPRGASLVGGSGTAERGDGGLAGQDVVEAPVGHLVAVDGPIVLGSGRHPHGERGAGGAQQHEPASDAERLAAGLEQLDQALVGIAGRQAGDAVERGDIVGVTVSDGGGLAARANDPPSLGRRVRIHTLPRIVPACGARRLHPQGWLSIGNVQTCRKIRQLWLTRARSVAWQTSCPDARSGSLPLDGARGLEVTS